MGTVHAQGDGGGSGSLFDNTFGYRIRTARQNLDLSAFKARRSIERDATGPSPAASAGEGPVCACQ